MGRLNIIAIDRSAMSDSADTSRSTVKTYVPAYQKASWQDHADDLDMSQSEFVRTMVQAGRRGFGGARDGDSTTPSSDANPQGSDVEDEENDDLATTVIDALSETPYM